MSQPAIDFVRAMQQARDQHEEALRFEGDARLWRLKAAVCQVEAILVGMREEIDREIARAKKPDRTGGEIA